MKYIFVLALSASLFIFSVSTAPQKKSPQPLASTSGAALGEGCYWTDCKSPFTYDYKCPLDKEEGKGRDKSGCEGSFVKYECCPSNTGKGPQPQAGGRPQPPPPQSNPDSTSGVIVTPQPV